MSKFYKLTHTEVEAISKCFSRAEMSIYLWLKSVDPYGNSLDIDTQDIATALGITRRTVQRALLGLSTKGFIDLEIKTFRFKWRSICRQAIDLSPNSQGIDETLAQRETSDEAIDLSPGDRFVAEAIDLSFQAIDLSPEAIDLSPTQPETLAQRESWKPKTNKDNKDLKDLSQESENLGQKQNAPSEELIGFVIRRIGHTAKNPRAYALAILKDDRSFWEEEFNKASTPPPEPEPEPIAAKAFNDRPKPPAIVVTSDRDQILGRAAAYVEMGRSENLAIFARKKLSELAKAHNITPEELRAFMERNNPDSVDVTIAHPLEVPRLANSDPDQEYCNRLQIAQWQFFEKPEDNRPWENNHPCPCGKMTILDCTGECGWM